MGRYLSQRTMALLIILGALTVLLVIATLFTSLTEEDLDVTSSTPIPLGTPEFRTTVEAITNSATLPLETDIEIFNDGTVFLEDLLHEIENASSSVTITNYIFREGVMTDRTFEALIKKAWEDVEVRLLLDAIGGHKAPEDKLEELREAGGKVEFFRPTNLRSLTRIHRRTHVRAIVIDGRVGYTGGLAFQDEWYGDGIGEEEWRDLMFKYGGRLARATQDHFNALWRNTNGEILTGPAFYPELPFSPEQTDSYFVSIFHAPAPDVSADLLDLIWLTISGARERIFLATPYLTPPHEIVEALKSAVERGVRVEILVPGPYTDTKIIQSATRSYYEELLDAGVHIFEYQPGRFHGKWMVADGRWSLIGSANMDNRSATLNVENVFGIDDENFARKLEEEFETDRDNAKEIRRDEWRPNIFKRAYYNTLALFAKQF